MIRVMGGDRALYRGLFEHAGVPLLVLADGGAVVDANGRALDWLGVALEAIRGRTLGELGIGELPNVPGDTTVTVRLHGADVVIRARIAAVDSHLLVTVLDGGDDKAVTAFERRLQIQRDLGRVLTAARDLASTLPQAIATLCGYDDWDGGAIWLPNSDGSLRSYGTWLRPGFEAPGLQDASRDALSADPTKLLGQVVATGRAQKVVIQPQGSAAYAAGMRRALVFPIFSGARVIGVGALSMCRESSLDIPEIGLLESAGQMLGLFVERMRAEERLQQVIDTLHEGIIIVDDAGTVLYFNPRAKEHYGFEGDDDAWTRALADRDTFETRTLDGTLVPVEQRPSARLRRGERVAGLELWVTRNATGARRALAYSGARLEQVDGRHISVLAFSDITSRVESTVALRELNDTLEHRVTERTKQLEAANLELEAFTYTVSHDLRAPVRAITSFSQIVVDEHSESLSEEARGLLLRVRNGGLRLGELVDDLLAFSQLGRHALRLRAVDVDAMVRGVVAQLVGEATNVDLDVMALGTCLADGSLLEQVWTNLIDNALKYSSPRECIHIAISRHDTPTDAIFSVRDNGVGFDMRHADKLFGVFQRLHSSDAFEGTGVGLANVRRIVERHGGRVSASSAVDAGSTFEFSLPLRRA
jgi:PAS domain S-box-containing protein